jgi:DNA primase
LLDQAVTFHRALPDRVRQYLNGRGIPDATINEYLLGWNGARITIPIRNRDGEIAFFKLRKDPDEQSDSPKMLTTPGSHVELYGWDSVLAKPESIVICEGEFDRLALEAQAFAAVTSTGGAGTFRPEWADAFREITIVYVCFDRDEAGLRGSEHVAGLIPHARIVRLPDEVGPGGDVTDFFVRLGRSARDFITLLETARSLPADESSLPAEAHATHPRKTGEDEVGQFKALIQIEDIVRQYLPLRASGRTLVGRCPFHDDRNPSFVVYPATQTFYCFGCQAHGDLLAFLVRMEHLTFPEALRVCRRLSQEHE